MFQCGKVNSFWNLYSCLRKGQNSPADPLLTFGHRKSLEWRVDSTYQGNSPFFFQQILVPSRQCSGPQYGDGWRGAGQSSGSSGVGGRSLPGRPIHPEMPQTQTLPMLPLHHLVWLVRPAEPSWSGQSGKLHLVPPTFRPHPGSWPESAHRQVEGRRWS